MISGHVWSCCLLFLVIILLCMNGGVTIYHGTITHNQSPKLPADLQETMVLPCSTPHLKGCRKFSLQLILGCCQENSRKGKDVLSTWMCTYQILATSTDGHLASKTTSTHKTTSIYIYNIYSPDRKEAMCFLPFKHGSGILEGYCSTSPQAPDNKVPPSCCVRQS